MVNAMKMKRHCRLLRLLPIFVLALMSPYCHGETLGDGYGVSENCIVATPVGYEKNITLSNGEVVKLYPDMLSFEDLTNCHAVVFCILSPRNHKGNRFVLRHSGCTCCMCMLPSAMTNLYQIGEYYVFEHPHTVSNILISTYEVRQPTSEFRMERDWGKKLYCSIEDVDERIQELKCYAAQDQAMLKDFQLQLQQTPSEERRKRHELKCRIIRIEHRLTNDIPRARSELSARRKWLLLQDDSNGVPSSRAAAPPGKTVQEF